MQKDVGSVSPEQSPASATASMWSKSAMRVDAGTSIALSAQAREDFHEQTALEAVITFLRKSGCPRQMTCDRDPRLSWEGYQVGIFPPHCGGSCCAWGFAHTCVRRIAPTQMPLERAFTGPTGKNAYRCINPVACKRCVRSQKRFSSTPLRNVPIRAGPAGTFLRVPLFQLYRHSQRFQNALTQMPGSQLWIKRCICVILGEMAA
jgi:hypothetical protein